MAMVPGCPDDLELASVLCRLRTRGPAILAARKAVPLKHLRPFTRSADDWTGVGGVARPGLLATAYSETDFEVDRAALRDALEAAAGQCGVSAFERMRAVADDLGERYLRGPAAASEIEDLTRAMRDWLPFVSRARFVPFYDEVSALPELPPYRSAAEDAVAGPPAVAGPQSHDLPADRHERDLAERGDKAGLVWAAVGYVPWRGLEGGEAPADPRCRVLEGRGATSDEALREALYLRHPVLLIVQHLGPWRDRTHPALPGALVDILGLPAGPRAAAMRRIVGLCIGQCRATAFELEDELSGQVDWSKFRPLLVMAADIIAAEDAPGSVVRTLLGELITEASRSWTEADTFAARATVLAVAITIASFGVGGLLAGIVIGIVDLGFQTAAISVHEGMVEGQNLEREQFNRLAMVDASLLVASDPETARLGWWLGALSLVMLPVGVAGLAQGAAAIRRGRALGELREASVKALEAARAASRRLPSGEVGLTRFTLAGAPPVPPTPAPTRATAPSPVDAVEAPRPVDLPPAAPEVAVRSPPAAEAAAPNAAFQADRKRLEDYAAGFGGMAPLEDDLARRMAVNPNAFARLQGEWRKLGFIRKSYDFLDEAITRGTARAAGRDPDAALARARASRAMRQALDRTTVPASPLTTGSPAVVRPPRGRPAALGSRETFIGPVRQKTWSLAPERWKRVVIDPEHPPDLVPNGIVLEFPNGERVWRTAGDEPATVIESMLGPSSKRKYFERAYFRRGEMDPSYATSRMELAHSQGQGTGFESFYAIAYAPSDVNQILQNLGIEEFLRILHENQLRGVTYKLVTTTSLHSRSLRLKQITYRVEAVFGGENRTVLTTGIRVEGSAEKPLVSLAEDLTYVDPEAFSHLPMNDLPVAIADRRREMFARLVQKWASFTKSKTAKAKAAKGAAVE
jgi:hypothetical protein